LEKIFILDPDKRMTVSQALNHPFISGKWSSCANFWHIHCCLCRNPLCRAYIVISKLVVICRMSGLDWTKQSRSVLFGLSFLSPIDEHSCCRGSAHLWSVPKHQWRMARVGFSWS
jgi:hypothetical protein